MSVIGQQPTNTQQAQSRDFARHSASTMRRVVTFAPAVIMFALGLALWEGVVRLFAVLHDSRRVNEATDPDHGPRAAEFALSLRGRLFELPDHEFRLLHRACAGHTHERTHPDVTIQTCWDADRLDLGRVGIMPHPSRLCTEAARRPEMIRWADGRASLGVVPEFVKEEWGIDLGRATLMPGRRPP